MTTHCLVGVRGDAQGFLQAAAVLVHPQGEVSVAFVHSCHPFLNLASVTVALLAEAVGELDQQLYTLLSLLRERRRALYAHTDNHMLEGVCVCVCAANLGSNVEVLVLLQQLLRVVDARASGGVCGQVKLPSVMNPLQSLKTHTHQTDRLSGHVTAERRARMGVVQCFVYLFGAAFKDHILLTLVQPPLPHGPEVENTILPL